MSVDRPSNPSSPLTPRFEGDEGMDRTRPAGSLGMLLYIDIVAPVLAAPIVLAALVLNALLLVDQELLIPNMIPKLVREHDEIHKEAKSYFPVECMQDEQNGLLRATRYYPSVGSANPPHMEVVDVIQRKEV